jgi:hypothetical protein
MFEIFRARILSLVFAFRNEDVRIESCKQMLSTTLWIKVKWADPGNEQLIIFETGKALRKNDKLDPAMVVRHFALSCVALMKIISDHVCLYRKPSRKFVN